LKAKAYASATASEGSPHVYVEIDGIKRISPPTPRVLGASAGEGGAYRSRTDDLLTASQSFDFPNIYLSLRI
jgi:hypothetical protein